MVKYCSNIVYIMYKYCSILFEYLERFEIFDFRRRYVGGRIVEPVQDFTGATSDQFFSISVELLLRGFRSLSDQVEEIRQHSILVSDVLHVILKFSLSTTERLQHPVHIVAVLSDLLLQPFIVFFPVLGDQDGAT